MTRQKERKGKGMEEKEEGKRTVEEEGKRGEEHSSVSGGRWG